MFVTGVVLAAGASRRLGRPKQLLPFGSATLLDATLSMARQCGFEQLLVTLGGAATDIAQRVDLSGCEIIENPDFETGCGSTIRAAIDRVDQRSDGIVLLLGDQPGVATSSVRGLISHAGTAPIGICHYQDGLGHPFWFGREMFGELVQMHGDKAVWKLLHSHRFDVAEVEIGDTVPIDVDTWDDYQALLATLGARPAVVGMRGGVQ